MIPIDYRDARPIYEQVRDIYRQQILAGILAPSTEMPSVRNLAAQLSVNPNTIQRAYRELELDGYIYSIKGKGSFVARNPGGAQMREKELLASFDKIVRELVSMGTDPASLANRISNHVNRGEKNG